ncbi:signal transducing adapter molecule 1 [Contarinia nasturtii]|uniref:signal transducing adapter molecule 1 n=1 Tax=Contarinia nasturtii TaxID=265458 RepID=UPI0012D41D1D|nr:signal transducing adapter molecule 1 [Contarinia nasturtii]
MFSLFGSTTPFDADVDKATSENNTTEQWDVIIDICDKAGANPKNAKDCIRSIMKRMGHNDPHVAIQAITLLDACIKNCGRTFHLEIASRDFETEFQRLMAKAIPSVAQKMRISLKKWAENEFKMDPQLNLIPSLYQKLKSEGADFSDTTIETPKPVVSKDPNVVSSQQEEDDIAKAIELSLKEKNEGVKTTTAASASSSSSFLSLYPSMNESAKSSPKHQQKKDGRKVRALYDFEAAEDNELTFFSGEIIYVLDDSDSNWWTGYNDRGEGLFPSNFVTADLNADLDTNRYDTKTNDVKSNIKTEEHKTEEIQIDEMKIDRLLHLLHEANPEDPSQDPEEMFILEAQVNQMLPLIDSELERVDRNHAKLTQLSTSLVEAINMYHMLMRESDIQAQFPPQLLRHPGPILPNGMYNPQFYSQMGGQYLNHSGSMPHQSLPQYQPNQPEGNTHQSLHHMQPVSQPFVNQYQPANDHHIQQAPGMISHFNQVPNMTGVPPNIPQQPNTHSMMPMHFQQSIAVDGAHLNNQHPIPVVESTQYQPNTVMTTQVQQQGIPLPVMVHHSSPNQQINPNTINQPVSSTILPQQPNIPVFQQQR